MMPAPLARFRAAVLIGTVAFFCVNPGAASSEITEDRLEAARQAALNEGKHLYVVFLGTGWSVSSQRFSETILESADFKEFARDHLVLLRVDARRKPKLSPEETAVLQSWVIHFDIKAYPTVILLAPDGQELLRHGYREVEARAYVDLLRAILPDA